MCFPVTEAEPAKEKRFVSLTHAPARRQTAGLSVLLPGKEKAPEKPGLSSYPQMGTTYFRLLSMPWQASTRPFTALTELSNMACSSLFMAISTTRSIPPAPITVGTPT